MSDEDYRIGDLQHRLSLLEDALSEERETRRSCIYEIWDALHDLQRAEQRGAKQQERK